MPTRRILKAVAHNLLDSLLSGPYSHPDGDILVHMERAGRSASTPVVTVDLLTGTVDPTTAGTPELQKLAATATERLRELLAGVRLPPTAVRAGVLRAECSPLGAPTLDRKDRGLQAVTITLEDDLGHRHVFICPPSWLKSTRAPHPGAPRPLPPRGIRTETAVTRFLGWLEQFLPRFG